MQTSPFLTSLLAAAAVACSTPAPTPPSTTGPDAAVATLDPTGNWTVAYDFQPACGNPSSTTQGTFTVTYGAMGYAVQVAGTESTGVLACGADMCVLSGTWAWAGSDADFQQSMNLTLGSDNTVSGEGTEQVASSDGSMCVYPFTASGSRS
jgi:hypothetical protein